VKRPIRRYGRTRGGIISATLTESEEQLQKSFSSAGASHAEFELLLCMVSRHDATGCIDAFGNVSDVSWAPPAPQAYGGSTGKNG
jgi:hypothetical protein